MSLGLAQVPERRLTDLGRRMIDDVARSARSLAATSGVLSDAEHAVIADHRASFAARHPNVTVRSRVDTRAKGALSRNTPTRTRTKAPTPRRPARAVTAVRPARTASSATAVRPEQIVSFSDPMRLRAPFRHFIVPDFMRPRVATRLLEWFEGDAPWRRHTIEGFYDTYDMLLRPADLPDGLTFLCDARFLDHVRTHVGRLFGVELDPYVHVAAHKMVPGFRMGVHSDFGETRQAYRLLVQLNRGWTVENGGVLLFLDEEAPTKTSRRQRYYIPEHRMGIGFEISARSFHGVSPIVSGDRYTLRMSFYHEGDTD